MSKFTYLFDVTNIKNVDFVALHWKYCDFKHQNCATLKTLKLMTSRWKMTSQWRHRCDFFELKEIGDGRWHIQVTSGRCCSKCCCCEQSNTNMTTHHKSSSSSTHKQTNSACAHSIPPTHFGYTNSGQWGTHFPSSVCFHPESDRVVGGWTFLIASLRLGVYKRLMGTFSFSFWVNSSNLTVRWRTELLFPNMRKRKSLYDICPVFSRSTFDIISFSSTCVFGCPSL